MVAAFEEFLKRLCQEALSESLDSGASIVFERLPKTMQVQSAFGTLDLAMSAPRGEQEERFDRLPRVRAACAVVVDKKVNPEAFTETSGNPNPRTVNAIFKALGISDVFSLLRQDFEKRWGRATHASFAGDKLAEIVNRRHGVAHSADALHISRADLGEAVRFLRVLGECLERATRLHMRKVKRQAKS